MTKGNSFNGSLRPATGRTSTDSSANNMVETGHQASAGSSDNENNQQKQTPMQYTITSGLREVARWITIVMALWSLCYYYLYGTKEGSQWIMQDLTAPLISEFDISWENGARLVMLVSPLLLVTSVLTLILTSAPLQSKNWWNRLLGHLRSFRTTTPDGARKKNQFGMGDINFDLLAVFLVTLPVMCFFFATLSKVGVWKLASSEEKLKAVGNAFGLAGTLALSFFLVPVTRHSILLVAMGWSPIHALRIHIWAGYTSYVAIVMHGIFHAFLWGKKNEPQLIPASSCWKWNANDESSSSNGTTRDCRIQWYNLTGVVSFLFMTVLVITSLNWFRRRHYRLFYMLHVVCAVGMLGAAAMHWRPIITFLAPSIIYYLASTTPALTQALACRLRGGVHISRIVHLADAGGCKEMHLSTTPNSNEALETFSSMFVKLCAPSISLVWHPFTVFKHPMDSSTVRILFRPVGPFTKKLALQLEQNKPSCMIVDGFYHAGNRTLEALNHDYVTVFCGGVAITPFLSLIPCLLKEIATRKKQGTATKTKRLALHWACREEGLATYVIENYLQVMLRAAQAMDFDFDVTVYHTRRPIKNAGPLDPSPSRRNLDGADESSMHLDTTFMSELTFENGIEVAQTGSMSSEQECPSNSPVKEEGASDSRMEKAVVVTCHHQQEERTTRHAMELHRFMPAKHQDLWRNIPAAVAIGGSMWMLFYVIFYYYNGYDVQVHEFYDRLWSIFVCVLSSMGLGLLFEVCALVERTFMVSNQVSSSSRPDSFASPAYMSLDEECRARSSISHRNGRPNALNVMRKASREATCPCIFLCGPPTMTEMARTEARKENALFGLTRFAIYEDVFEM